MTSDLLAFLTPQEHRRLLRRRKIFSLLKQGLTVREIASRLRTSTATVIKVKKQLSLQQKTPSSKSQNVSIYVFGHA